MIQPKPTLTVAIPAYNEKTNIVNILQSLLTQKQIGFELKKILVYSDASTDKTNEKVKALSQKNPVIKLKAGKQRKGKYFRVNLAFKECKSDYLVIMDADIGLVGKNFLEQLVNVLLSDSKANMVSAHNILLRHNNFMGKIIHAHLSIWDNVRLSFPNYDSGLNFFGSATAYRGSFARSINMPADLMDPHLFIYLTAKKTNSFSYCRNAEVLQWSIGTFKDLKKLLRRSIGKKDKKLEKKFGNNVEKVYFVPTKYKIIGFLKALKSEPFYTLLSLILQIYITKIVNTELTNNTPLWDIIPSTKKPIAYEK